jgi:hypothetical protein
MSSHVFLVTYFFGAWLTQRGIEHKFDATNMSSGLHSLGPRGTSMSVSVAVAAVVVMARLLHRQAQRTKMWLAMSRLQRTQK